MAQIYAHRWTAPHGESPDALGSSAETWAKGLAGISGQQLAEGLKACITRADEWPPTLPAFRALCLGIPPLSAIRRELASEDADRSGFAVLVWSKLDGFSFRRAEGKAADKMLSEAYDEAREYVMQGGEIPPPRVALPPPKPEPIKPASPEAVSAAMAEAKKLFG